MFQIPYSRHSFSRACNVFAGAFGPGRRPHLVFDEDAAAALVLQVGHLGHQPVVGGHLHQRQRVGVVEHAGQVDDQPRAGRPVDVHRRRAVEHAAQGVLEQLDQRRPATPSTPR